MNSEVSQRPLFCIGVLLWHLPLSTKENIDKPQSQPVQGRDLNPRPPKYETNAERAFGSISSCLQLAFILVAKRLRILYSKSYFIFTQYSSLIYLHEFIL